MTTPHTEKPHTEHEIPFNDLGRGTRALRPLIDDAIARVLDSGWFVLGPEHNSLESEIAEYLGVGDAVLVGNGTDALQLALIAIGVRADDTVLTVANAGGYTSTAVRSLGATPVFADVDPSTLLVSVSTLSEALDRLETLPSALVVTHLFGASADMTSIMRWADAVGIPVIEDCAQSMGAVHAGKKAGSFGRLATTSFYPTKNLGALGDGGCVFTSDPALATRLRQLRQYGWTSKYVTALSGGRNSRMDELQAAIVRVKLPFLDAWNDRRREIHQRYEAAVPAGVRMVNHAQDGYVGHLAVIETADREKTRTLLTEAGIHTDVHYPIPDHKQPILAGTIQPSLPVTEAAAERILSLPLFPELEDSEVDRITDVLKRI
ncbi:DegT/DnrJ/EryC1/StrS family aminotransferase [Cryobacterium algoricola]|uniref:DegT/DnrJ/EryC1/StrS family aminotransferase n=1 Tax=Cryobacterium algoricola TaxID=1259183 RepID=UPI0018E0BD22|nr:DegT/DnrJ/EryC1/StrS family aminotransferase [Cryobacterium algoricola]